MLLTTAGLKVNVVLVAPATRLVVKGADVPVILYQELLAAGVPGLEVKVNVAVMPELFVMPVGEMPEMAGLAVTVKVTTLLVAEPDALVRIAKKLADDCTLVSVSTPLVCPEIRLVELPHRIFYTRKVACHRIAGESRH